jgi:hypothetical protein
MNELENAVTRVFELRKNNPKWDIQMIVSKVSTWNRVDYNTLFKEILKRKKKKKSFSISEKMQEEEEFQPPWWTYNN